MRILFVEDDFDVRETMIELIKLDYDCQVIEAATGNQAIDILKNDKNFNLIISDYNMKNGHGGDIYRFVKTEKLPIPFLLFSAKNIVDLPDFTTFFEDFPGNSMLVKPATGQEFSEKIKYALNPGLNRPQGSSSEKISGPDFKGESIESFLRFNKGPCNVFLKLADDKYIKIVNYGAINHLEIVQKYYDKGVKELFVMKEDYYHFIDSLVQIMLEINKIEEELPTGRLIQNLNTGHIIFKKQLIEFGISPHLIELAHSSVEKTMKIILKNPTLKDLLANSELKTDKVFYHCLLTSYLASGILNFTEWNSEATTSKLCMASFLHDIMLEGESDFLLELEGQRDTAKMSPNFLSHPAKSADLVRLINDLPSDLDHIILQHHEFPSGEGFPRNLAANHISALSAIFIVAHECAINIIRFGATAEMKEDFLSDNKKFFEKGHFKVAHTALKKLFSST